MLTLAEIQLRAHATACEKGWHDRPMRTGIIAFVTEPATPGSQAALVTEGELAGCFAEPSASAVTLPGVAFGQTVGHARQMVWQINHDAVLRSHALIHTELTEMLDDIDGGRIEMTFREEDDKPEGLGVEVADVVLRVCDTMQALGLSFGEDALVIPERQAVASKPQEQHMHDLISAARKSVDKATEAARVDAWGAYVDRLHHVLAYVVTVAVAYSIDLPTAIEAKMAYNATRPTRHGGKKA